MNKGLEDYLAKDRDNVYKLLQSYFDIGKPFLLRSEILDALMSFCSIEGHEYFEDCPLGSLLGAAQEAALDAPWFYFAVRDRAGRWRYFCFHQDTVKIENVSVSDYLSFKERLVNQGDHKGGWVLEIDLGPFNREFPKMHELKSIGRGVEFLNRNLSSKLFEQDGKGINLLLDFLRVHQHNGRQLMINETINDIPGLRQAIRTADGYLQRQPRDAQWNDVRLRMKDLGFESGWGKTVARMRETLSLLSDVLEAPDPLILEEFLGRIPMIYRIVIISPHGFFCQSNVLGFPDTGGQVVYILDQVRALEREMIKRIEEQGYDLKPDILVVTRLIPDSRGTTCDQRLEKIIDTTNARILRVPFKDPSGAIVPHWISRFEIWPYLEQFAEDAEREILAELMERPDLIIGNYSDGNLVASLLSRRFQVTQCNIAHALEKAKYIYSDLFWQKSEKDFHFSCLITADLISMNTADFIITSTYQEIAGNAESIGQYESYQSFTLPGLYRVVNGIDVYDPKFNIVSPGADAEVFFPYVEKERRLTHMHGELEKLVFGKETGQDTRGVLEDTAKPLLFTMARMDRIKNLTGLTELFGRSDKLREKANLLVVSGQVDAGKSVDEDEKDQIGRMHEIMKKYDLDAQVRWCGIQLNRQMSGELYRFIADRRGVFVQPAVFEAFGLTIIEAMISGLPTFATQYGGPLEIIEDGISGFHINPNHGDRVAGIITDFFNKCEKDTGYWDRISRASIQRVKSRYTWKLYAERIMTLSRVYGFLKYATNLERDETRRYLEMFYGLEYRKLVEKVPTFYAREGIEKGKGLAERRKKRR